jgi:hypothetical protein
MKKILLCFYLLPLPLLVYGPVRKFLDATNVDGSINDGSAIKTKTDFDKA